MLGFFNLAAFGTFGILPIEGAFCLAAVYTLYHAVWRGRQLRMPSKTYLYLILAVWGVVALSSASTIIQGDRLLVIQSLKTFSHFTFIVGTALILLLLPLESHHWRNALRFHFFVSFLIMVFGLYQLPARILNLPLGWVEFSNVNFMRGIEEADPMTQLALMYGNFYRATSLFNEPSALAVYGGTSLIMLIVPLFRRGTHILHNRTFIWFSVVLTTIAVFLTFSLTGVMILCASAVLLIVLYRQSVVKGLTVALVVGTALIGAADFVVYKTTDTSVLSLFAQRITSIASGRAADDEADAVEGESLTQRIADYKTSVEIWRESPILGVGPGNFSNSKFGRYHNSEFPATTYGSSLAELGLIGCTVVTIFLIAMYVGTQKEERNWTRSSIDKGNDIDALAIVLPFKALIIIFVGITGNFLVTGVFWFDVVFLVSCVSAVRRAMGSERLIEFQIVSAPWRSRLHTAWGMKSIHDADHRRESNSSYHS